MQSQVRRQYLPGGTLAHWKRTHLLFFFYINCEDRKKKKNISAVFHCLPSISKEQSLQVPKSKKDPKICTEKSRKYKPVIKSFPEVAQNFLKHGDVQKSVSWARRRNNASSARAGSTAGDSGGSCVHSSATHHRRYLKYCHSL